LHAQTVQAYAKAAAFFKPASQMWQAPYWSLGFSIDPDALLVNADPLFTAHRELLVTLAARYRLPWGLMLRSS
jgi:hypothetical protein